jgi:hypothetical protein
MTNELPVPAWAEEQRMKMLEMMSATKITEVELDPHRLSIIDGFSTHFAEFDVREDDLIVHVFPRQGGEDKYTEGRYTNHCRNCGFEVPMPKSIKEINPCPKCKHTGLKYIPGRLETKNTLKFPTNMEQILTDAAKLFWMGDVAIEYVPEVNSYAMQFKDIRPSLNRTGVDNEEDFVLKLCEAVDNSLEK